MEAALVAASIVLGASEELCGHLRGENVPEHSTGRRPRGDLITEQLRQRGEGTWDEV